MRKILLTVCALIISTPVFADTLVDENTVKEFSNKVMEAVGSGNIDSAFVLIKPHCSIDMKEVDKLARQTKDDQKKNEQIFGKPDGYEFIDSKKLGNSLMRLRYFQKNENHVRCWSFFFYNGKSGWRLVTFNWKDDHTLLFI